MLLFLSKITSQLLKHVNMKFEGFFFSYFSAFHSCTSGSVTLTQACNNSSVHTSGHSVLCALLSGFELKSTVTLCLFSCLLIMENSFVTVHRLQAQLENRRIVYGCVAKATASSSSSCRFNSPWSPCETHKSESHKAAAIMTQLLHKV